MGYYIGVGCWYIPLNQLSNAFSHPIRSRMKRTIQYLAVGFFSLALISCGSLEGLRVNVSPNPLEVHADTIKASVKGSVPPKSGFKKEGAYTGKFVIKDTTGAGGDKFSVGSVSITYAQFPEIVEQGAVTTSNIVARYDPKMDGKYLVVENGYVRKGKTYDLGDIAEMKLAPCCITTSQLIRDTDYAFGEDGMRGLADAMRSFPNDYKQSVAVERNAVFQFPKDIWKIQNNEYKKEDIVAIGEFIKAKYNTTKIRLEGFASPEGPYARNQFLAINRLKEVQKWLMEQLKAAGYEAYLDSSFFETATTSEDWEGFKANLDQTSYPEETKRQIIEIVSAGYDEDEKEARIMALVGGKNRVENILAPLRRTTIIMYGTIDARSPEATDALARGFLSGEVSSDSLRKSYQQEEYLFAAERLKDAKEQEKLMAEYVKAYPDDYRGYNNLGILAVKNGNPEQAYEYFQQANKKKPNDPAIINNMARVQMMRGKPEDAVANARGSYEIVATPEAAYVLGVDHAKRGRYTESAKMFDEAGSLKGSKYNAGLVKMLANDVAGAKSSFEAAIAQDANDAWAHYGLAILGARNGDTNLMVQNLRNAVDKDKTLGAKAEKDLEFRSYWENADFKAAVKR